MPPFGISLQSGVLVMLDEDQRVKIEQNSQAWHSIFSHEQHHITNAD
ncbi:hypothetical protein [Nitrosomonas sp. Nm51]|nr:hypothetical protein [Nitrosomonas sp. Nm51]